MGLRDKIVIFYISAIFCQITNSDCLPRRYKSCSSNARYPISHKITKQIGRAQPKTCNVAKKIPVTEWEIPEVPNFENNFDLSKLCLTPPPPVFNKKCKCGGISNGALNPFEPFPEPFCFKEKGSFPDVDYPLDVRDFRIPNYRNDFVEEQLKQKAKEIDGACKELYEGKSSAKPKPRNKAIEKAVNALIKSQTINKESQKETVSVPPLPKNSENDCIQPTACDQAAESDVSVYDDVKSPVKSDSKENGTGKNNISDNGLPLQTSDVITKEETAIEPAENVPTPTVDEICAPIDDSVPISPVEDSALVTGDNPLPSPIPEAPVASAPIEIPSEAGSLPVDSTPIAPVAPVGDKVLQEKLAEEVVNSETPTALTLEDENFSYVTLPPSMEQAPRVIRSCLEKHPSVYLCPGDEDYMIV